MHRLIKPIFWTFLFLVMMLVIDQFLVQMPSFHPAHQAVSHFYRDFRGRLIELTLGEKTLEPESIEAVIEEQQEETAEKAVKKTASPDQPSPGATAGEQQRYIYSDQGGELHFTDSLQEVPARYRDQAQPIGD